MEFVGGLDAQHLENQLPLLAQALTLGLPTLLVLHHLQQAQRLGLQLDVPALETALGVPVLILESKHEAIDPAQLADTLFDLAAPQDPILHFKHKKLNGNWVQQALQTAFAAKQPQLLARSDLMP